MITPELDAALDAVAEHERLSRRLDRAQLDEASAGAERDRLARLVEADEDDVEGLESFSPTRIWARLRGTLASDLDRERAELDANRYAAAAAADTLAVATAARRQLEAALAALGDVRARREQALAAEETRLRAAGGGTADQLVEVSGQLASVRSQLVEVAEARAAERVAARELDAAAQLLSDASGWADFDVFLGGGMLTDLAKYDKMDAANARLREASAALGRLGAELADVGLKALDGVALDELERTFDLWFDNIFSDWAVRTRIEEARERTNAAVAAVARVGELLQRREADLRSLQQTLVTARETLLIGR